MTGGAAQIRAYVAKRTVSVRDGANTGSSLQ